MTFEVPSNGVDLCVLFKKALVFASQVGYSCAPLANEPASLARLQAEQINIKLADKLSPLSTRNQHFAIGIWGQHSSAIRTSN